MAKLPANQVRQLAQGHWEAIFSQLAGDALGVAIDAAKKRSRDSHVPCPIHGGKDGFRLFSDWETTGGAICNTCGSFHSGFDLLMAVNHWNFRETLEAVANVLGLTQETIAASKWTPPSKLQESANEPVDPEMLKHSKERQKAAYVWQQATKYDASEPAVEPLRRYLDNRSIGFRSISEIRFTDRAMTLSEGKTVRLPAMLAAVRDIDGNLVTIHRTFLTDDGHKANVEQAKKLMKLSDGDSISGCAIHFGKPGKVLCVAEGIETALSVVRATGLACWSAISANGLKAIEVPQSVERVFIFADKDASKVGENAAQSLKERLTEKGLEVRIFLPSMSIPEGAHGVDWNDVLAIDGPAGFPVRAAQKR